jgi:hypothetical protein
MKFYEKLGDVSEKMRGLASRGKAMLKPSPVVFGSPRQIDSASDVSWWHIPVFIDPTAMHRPTLDNCRVQLIPDGGTAPLNMRWRIKNSSNTVATATLEEGQVYLVPVAARKEAGKRTAIITNEIFLVKKTAKWAMPPGKSKWSLRIHNEDGEWESAHSYVLLVPKPDWGNGHFLLEVRYDGLD